MYFYYDYICMQGCQDAGGNKRSTGTQDTAKFTTDDKGVTSITYSGGSENRYVCIICTHAYD